MKFPKLRLKSAKHSDLRSVKRLFSGINKKIKHEQIAEMIEKRKVYVLKDRKRKVKAAFAYSIFTIAGYFTFVYISKLAVDPNMQGQGIGTFLISQIRAKSLRIGATAFFLFSVKKAHMFYKKNKMNGFWRIFWWRSEALSS